MGNVEVEVFFPVFISEILLLSSFNILIIFITCLHTTLRIQQVKLVCKNFQGWSPCTGSSPTSIELNAALTHTSRPYCDLKTSKIAFFFRKSFGFLSNFQISVADGPRLCSLVFNTFSLCPQYDPFTSMAFPLRLYCVPKATQMRLCYVLCVLTATLRRLLRLSGDCPATVRRPYYVVRTQ